MTTSKPIIKYSRYRPPFFQVAGWYVSAWWSGYDWCVANEFCKQLNKLNKGYVK